MPAKSKSQQRLFGMLHAYNKGSLKVRGDLETKLEMMSKSISDESARHFAETPHAGLPEKKAYALKALEKLAGFMHWTSDASKTTEVNHPYGPLEPITYYNVNENRHVPLPGKTGPTNAVWSTESGRKIGGPYGAFWRNTDPSIPLGEFFYRHPNTVKGGKHGEIFNIPGNKTWTKEDCMRISNLLHGSFNKMMPQYSGKDKGRQTRMGRTEIYRGLKAHSLGDRYDKLRILGDHYGTYDLNRRDDPVEWLGGYLPFISPD